MMSSPRTAFVLAAAGLFASVLQAAGVSQADAEAFARKMTVVAVQGVATADVTAPSPAAPRQTPFTEAEVNSFFAYQGRELLPNGIADARVTIIGNGRVSGAATVDLEALAKDVSTGGAFNPLSFLTGRVPVTVSGLLQTANGVGRFDIESATVSGVPVPATLLRDAVAYYSRAADDPEGVRLGEPFPLPANIRRIEVAQGQAVVVQ
jgi:hypothetical protein